MREQAAEDLARVQTETRELRRSANDDSNRLLTRARTEADELRSAARTLLAEARAEVAVLSAHRDEISKQLGDLSGVINALAVPESSGGSRRDNTDGAGGTAEGVPAVPTGSASHEEAQRKP